MKTYHLVQSQELFTDIDTAWNFISDPNNLQLITPPDLKLSIRSGLNGEIYDNQVIKYKVRPIFNIPAYWETEISGVEKNWKFTDSQVKGPYRKWVHQHIIVPSENGVIMEDILDYELPMGFLGRIAHKLLIEKKIRKIFEFRRNAFKAHFNK